ncbi:MAG: 1-acyl-sn-glycerol-3-phosphate acyltransferase [Eubacteriales bacterium]
MKIKNVIKDYDEIMAMEVPKYRKPKKPTMLFQTLTRLVSIPDLLKTGYSFREVGMEKLGKDEPALILMNHSSFLDLEIAYYSLWPRKVNTVTTLDAFIGREWLLRQIGCFPTRKFVADIQLIKDINYCLEELKTSVLMYPEAGYTFDGTKTTMPSSLAPLVKRLGVPFCMFETFGAFLRDPLYNNLQNRKIKVSAELRYVLSAEQIARMSVEEIGDVINREFSFDGFRWQQENGVVIDEPFRADGLHRILYKCPHCKAEGKTVGKGIHITCGECGKSWELTENGFLKATEGETEFNHVPDWYAWERECVREEIREGKYGFDVPVDIYMIVNTKGVYKTGSGRLTHGFDGIHLTGCDGKLDYYQKSISMYTLNSDFYWYTLGDVIGIGNSRALYYAMPTEHPEVVCKARLAAEEIFKILKAPKEQEVRSQ